jgi:uncharacterized protein YybS (DUF2232 family)
MGQWFSQIRWSLADWDFHVVEEPNVMVSNPAGQHFLFWIMFVISIIFSSLVFLNFIIAEVTNSYNNVNENIQPMIYKERSQLIKEAEDIMFNSTKRNKNLFPKFIIIREKDN